MIRNRFSIQLIILAGLLILLTGLTGSPLSLASGDSTCAADRAKNTDPCNTIQGFGNNAAMENVVGATVAGGGEIDLPNRVTANFGSVGGGIGNQAGEQAAVAGGAFNSADGYRSTVGGGASNHAITGYSTIAGGTNNTTDGIQSTIGGGAGNTASGRDATIAGGSGNIADFTDATIGGGIYNTASNLESTVAGGGRNTASGTYATVSGGTGNRASALDTTVAGGSGNSATADEATIGGGLVNRATDKFSTVAGGSQNVAGNADDDLLDAEYATVGGGQNNTASGSFSTIPGGAFNVAGGAYSLAAGRRAKIDPAHIGSILFADSNDFDFPSQSANEFAARATGGVRFVTGIGPSGNPIAGVRIAPGSGAWEVLSDASAKTNVAPADGRAVLQALAQVPVSTWSYQTEDTAIRHIGPMAQDFAKLGVGEDNHYINTVDASGVALAAIQGLNEVMREEIDARDAQIAALKAENAAQQSRLGELDSRISELERKVNSGNTVSRESTTNQAVLFVALGLVGLVAGYSLRKSRL